MKNWLALIGAFTSVLLATEAQAAVSKHSAELFPDNEVTPPVLNGHEPEGNLEVKFDTTTNRLCGRFLWRDLTGVPTGIHVHQAPTDKPDDDGPAEAKIIIPVPAGVTPEDGEVRFNISITSLVNFATSLTKHEIYGNVHTAANTKGEIRGSLWPNDEVEDGAVTCPAETPQDAGTPGSDASTTPPPSSSSGSTNSSSGDDNSSGGDDETNEAEESTKPPAKEDGGCSTTGSPSNALSLGIAAGLSLLVIAAGRRRRNYR